MLTTTETKKAQLSLFIILGIALLLSAGLLLLTKEKPKTKTPEAELEQEALAVQKYIDQCLQQALTGAENTGLREDQKEQQEAIQKAYVQYSMKSCADLKTFEKQGLQTSAKEPEATISLEGNVLAAILKYPVKVRKGQAEITLSAFSHYIKKEASATITQDQYGTTTERTIITDDKKAELHIPAETRISFP
ncbi:hypothetical protein HY640_04615, partial [Candidatus Woesearchaeota archaeon]|nr:hypothetical protein [Candidatus Woesearchaeota archaeon]